MRSKSSKPKERMYVVTKFVLANRAYEALRLEKKCRVDDCRLAPSEAQPRPRELECAVGFTIDDNQDDDDE